MTQFDSSTGGSARPTICHIVSGLGTGGAERQLHGWVTSPALSQFEHRVLSLKPVDTKNHPIAQAGVEVQSLALDHWYQLPAALMCMRRLLKVWQPDVLQGWMYHGNVFAWLASRSHRSPLAWNVRHALHDLSKQKLSTRWLVRIGSWLSAGVDLVVFNSEVARQQHVSRGFRPAKSAVVANGFDSEQWTFSASARERVRQSLDIPEDASVVGHVGRWHAVKNQPGFVRAMLEVLSAHPDAVALMAGQGVDEHNHTLLADVPPLLKNRFKRLGRRDDVAALMSAMDVLCNTSWSESSSNVVGEAMAVGVPCAVTDVGNSAELVGDHGIVVAPGDDAGMAEAVSRLLKEPAEDKRARRERTTARIRQCFDIHVTADEGAALYAQLIEGSS